MKESPAQPNASQCLAAALASAGVRFAFGMPGGEVLPLIDALREFSIEFVLVRHEGSAGFMADAVWQRTGAPGVVVATLGPGVTNLVSGLAGAALDRAPLVAITGRLPARLQSVYTHQVLDHVSLLRPLVKHSVTLSAEEAWREAPMALRRLWSGRPGPVHIELPLDVATAPQPGFWADHFAPVVQPNPEEVTQAAALLGSAQHPVILLGPGDRSVALAEALAPLVSRLHAPTLTTYRAKGLLDEDSPWSAGSFGLSPVVDGHQAQLLASADIILTVGFDPAELRPHWLPGWPEAARLIAVDSAAPLDLLHPVEHLLIGAPPAILSALLAALPAPRSRWSRAAVEAHRTASLAAFDDGPNGPAAAIRAIQAGAPPDVVACLDVGAHRITASHVWKSHAPGRLLQSNGLASMGFGLPAAIASRLCDPSPALAIVGDMGLWMALGELGVAQERGLDLVVCYLADQSLSLIELKQERSRLVSVGVRFENPAVEPLAMAFGGVGLRVSGPEQITHAVQAAFSRGGLSLIEVVIDAAAYRRQM